MIKEAVILAGGRPFRMKSLITVAKPFVLTRPEKEETLLEYQINWLTKEGFEHIILAFSRSNFKYLRKNFSKFLNNPLVDVSIEEEYVGTAGGLRKAFHFIEEDTFYCMNLDDVTFYDTNTLYAKAGTLNSILVQKTNLPYAEVKFIPSNDNLVTEYNSRLKSDNYASCGHYVFNKRDVETLLPFEGTLDLSVFPELVSSGLLRAEVLEGKWIKVNNQKDMYNLINEGRFVINDKP